MSDQSGSGSVPPPILQVSKHARRYSKEFVATMISLVTTALGVVLALAWNTALTGFFDKYLSEGKRVVALFSYAILITLIGVFAVFFLGKLAARIGAEPVGFKAPEKKD